MEKTVTPSSSTIVRSVRVDRTRTPQEALDATGRLQYTDKTVVDAMPRGAGKAVEVHFFPLSRYVSDEELEEAYKLHGFKPADPYSLAAVNEGDASFADDHPNSTRWKDDDGRWCYAAFHRWLGERSVSVGRRAGGWFDFWWFAGLRK